MPFPGSAEELEDILRAYARTFAGRVRGHEEGDGFVLSLGSLLATNPNELRWGARAVPDRGTLRIAAEAITFPWSRRRARRLVEARVEQLADFVETKLRGGAVGIFRERTSRFPFRPVGPDVAGASVAVASWAAQTCAALAAAFLMSLLLGLVLVDAQIAEVSARVAAAVDEGRIPVPSQDELASIDLGYRLGASLVLVFPLAFLVGAGYGLVHILGDLWVAVSRWTFWAFAFFVLLLSMSLWSRLFVLVWLPFAVLIPAAAHGGVTLVWSFRRERRREPVEIDGVGRRRRMLRAACGAVAGLLVLAAFAPRSGERIDDRLAVFRDRFLLTGEAGRGLASFYYRHTPLAAEAMVPDAGGAEGLSRLCNLGWLAAAYAGPFFLLFLAAGVLAVPVALLYRKLRETWAAGVVGVLFLLGFGVLALVLGAHSEEIRKVGEIRSAGPADLGSLVGRLSDDGANVRYEAAYRVWQILPESGGVPPEAVNALLGALEDPDVRVRIWACGALGRLGDPRAAGPLVGALRDGELVVRYRAAEALGNLKTASAVNALEQTMRTDCWYVAAYAHAAVRKIGPFSP